jgi:hypothetical protein
MLVARLRDRDRGAVDRTGREGQGKRQRHDRGAGGWIRHFASRADLASPTRSSSGRGTISMTE